MKAQDARTFQHVSSHVLPSVLLEHIWRKSEAFVGTTWPGRFSVKSLGARISSTRPILSYGLKFGDSMQVMAKSTKTLRTLLLMEPK